MEVAAQPSPRDAALGASAASPRPSGRFQEWWLPLTLGIALAAVTAVPYVYASQVQPHGQVFMGFFYLGDDANTYLAKMRQGWEGAWAWQNRYTTESSPPAYLFLFWILLGHLAAVTGLPLLTTFHLARIAAALALMAAAWALITHFIEDSSARRFAIWFCAIGLGLGYVIQALGHPVIAGNRTDTLDWRMPELSAFYSVLALPHFAWSGVFEAAGVVLVLKAMRRPSVLMGLFAGLAFMGQACIHPQMPILMGAAVLAAAVYRRPSARGWLAFVLAFAVPAPYVAYSYLAFTGNPEVERWTFHSKNALPPESISLFFALAPQLLLALSGLPGVIKRRSREDIFLVAWLVLLAAILYLPNPAGDLRRRFLDGIYLPLDILAAKGMFEAIVPRLRSARARALIPFSYVAFSAIGSAFLVLAPLAVATSPLYVVSSDEYNGLTWIGTQPAGRVLAMPGVGLYVPAYSSDTVYVGHYDETFDYVNKTNATRDVLTGKADLLQFIYDNDIRYVVWTADLKVPPPAVLGPPAYNSATFMVFRTY